MKLLFDENLSPKLPNRLSDIFPHSLHVRDVGMKATSDPIVWDYAKDNNLMSVSKDADMHDLSLVFGNPPKVIWIRLGNCSTLQVENLLRRDFNAIKLFSEDRIPSVRCDKGRLTPTRSNLSRHNFSSRYHPIFYGIDEKFPYNK
jgi:predicted nuclease of predicted toxin-antitoxin system